VIRSIHLHPSWLNLLHAEFDKEYMHQLRKFLLTRKQHHTVTYPPGAQIFSALNSTPFDDVRVVILGQDPYHGPGQAHGLCFSVLPGVKIPPSLSNIYRELEADLGIAKPQHGYLQSWAEQGVLLLNSVLTVDRGQAGSHHGKGWENFTDTIMRLLNDKCEGLVFMLWGSYAIKKGAVIDDKKHLVLKAPHPSPLSAYRGFLGCRHFSSANEYLQQQKKPVIDWSIAE
jgi:uracil-DNA glycosylase